MRLAEPVAASWKARLSLAFERRDERTVLASRSHDGPLVVQRPLYPEGGEVCHAIVVHPPGGIAGGDQLTLDVACERGAHALLTTPGAGKWYRSGGTRAAQSLAFRVAGTLEWLPRETILFDGALAELRTSVQLAAGARFIGWEVLCFGRRGSGEQFTRGCVSLSTRIAEAGRPIFVEQGELAGGSRLMNSPAGLGGRSVLGSFIATSAGASAELRAAVPELALTEVSGLLIARYLGDSSEQALRAFTRLWTHVRPLVVGRAAVMPRIWST